MAEEGLLGRARLVAPAGTNRWRVPPAALAIHLSIGMAYGLSVFWLPLSQAVGVTKPRACPAGTGLLYALTARDCDWRVSELSWIFTIAIVCLGLAAAVGGRWLERVGPRRAGLVAALCWPGGLLLMAAGVRLHALWLMWLGGGVIGGVGLGLGYISPVSTLVRWFPDRPGLATGLAIMGFGGGAMVGAPLAAWLMARFHTAQDVGVAPALAVLAALYLVWMVVGAFLYRLPPPGYAPRRVAVSAGRFVPAETAHRTPQFWLLWAVLCLNVSAGIGVLDMASPLLQEIFGGALVHAPGLRFAEMSAAQHKAAAGVAAGFAGFLSLFNIIGRFAWSSFSDRIGRKTTYAIFFLLGIALYASVPAIGAAENRAVFALAFGLILSMYGGGFATIPAYIADLFGTRFVGAIHGRLLTAWSAAGVIGPLLVTYIREAQLARGVPHARAYDNTMYVLAGLLALGFVANLAIRPVAPRWFRSAEADRVAGTEQDGLAIPTAPLGLAGFLSWVFVGVPLAWGFYMTVLKAAALFGA